MRRMSLKICGVRVIVHNNYKSHGPREDTLLVLRHNLYHRTDFSGMSDIPWQLAILRSSTRNQWLRGFAVTCMLFSVRALVPPRKFAEGTLFPYSNSATSSGERQETRAVGERHLGYQWRRKEEE